jgi:hypothetical protein
MIFRPVCCSRNLVWRYQHSFDKEGVCIFCDRTESQAQHFLEREEYRLAKVYWPVGWERERQEAKRRHEKYRHYELNE